LAYLGNRPAEAYSAFQKQDFSTSATTSYTLDHPVANQNEIALFINFVRQEPTTAYTASGTSLTLTSATSSSDDMYCIYLGKAVQTVNPPSGSVGSSQVAASIITGQTAETSIATDDTVLIHDTSAGALRKMTRANFVSGIGETMTPAFLAYRSGSTQSIASATGTKIQLNSELFDTDNAFDNSTNYRFTPQTAGKYFFFATSRFDTDTDFNTCELQVHKNGAQYSDVTWRNEYYEVATVTGVAIMNGSSDYLELVIYQNSGSSQNIGYDSGNRFLTKFGAYRIIE